MEYSKEKNISDLFGRDGSSISWEVQEKSSNYALRIADILKTTAAFKEIAGRLNSPRTLLYLQQALKNEIYSYVRHGRFIRWCLDNDKPMSPEETVVEIPDRAAFELLGMCWDMEDVRIRFRRPCLASRVRAQYGRIRPFVKKLVYGMLSLFNISRYRNELRDPGVLACHHCEGFDRSKRNDLNWFENSGIEPGRVLIYFDFGDIKTGKPTSARDIRRLEQTGFRWDALKPGVVENQGMRFWQPAGLKRSRFFKNRAGYGPQEKWLVRIGNRLLVETDYWRQFNAQFNVKVHYAPEEGPRQNIAQAIVSDMYGKKGCILAGKQESDMFHPVYYKVGFHPRHVFFVWNDRAKGYLLPNYEQVETLVITGYPNDLYKKRADLTLGVREKGARFVIAFFDTGCMSNSYAFPEGVAEFYKAFLRWVIEDPQVGLIIKSKKPPTIKHVPGTKPLLDEAFATGRCIRTGDEYCRLASDASVGADMAVGCGGFSSALVEAVLAGSRGVNYDMTHRRSHEYYSWADGSIIFDDLGRMMVALKRYKTNPGSEPALGDWSGHIDHLDPFRDGKGGARMGQYMRWLLEAFDRGMDRTGAMEYANERYAGQWGHDKVIDMRHVKKEEVARHGVQV